jgi:hypothetical protein
MELLVTGRRFDAKLSLDDVTALRSPYESDALGYGYTFLSAIYGKEVFRVAHDIKKESRVVALLNQYVELYLGSSAMTQLQLTGKFEMIDKGHHFRIEMPDYESATSEWAIPRRA